MKQVLVIINHHHLIYSTLKTTFNKGKPKLYKYRNYKKFDRTAFQTDLQKKLEEDPKVYQNFEETFVRVLGAHAPRKTKTLNVVSINPILTKIFT